MKAGVCLQCPLAWHGAVMGVVWILCLLNERGVESTEARTFVKLLTGWRDGSDGVAGDAEEESDYCDCKLHVCKKVGCFFFNEKQGVMATKSCTMHSKTHAQTKIGRKHKLQTKIRRSIRRRRGTRVTKVLYSIARVKN